MVLSTLGIAGGRIGGLLSAEEANEEGLFERSATTLWKSSLDDDEAGDDEALDLNTSSVGKWDVRISIQLSYCVQAVQSGGKKRRQAHLDHCHTGLQRIAEADAGALSAWALRA